ncbi:monocarboxylate transporter 12-like [Diadema setosum]|uniref:monocarboxylate transporter 12-like n=1 Tax=Diadema setosum TaxID=31175 RepID=UPI003B3A0932
MASSRRQVVVVLLLFGSSTCFLGTLKMTAVYMPEIFNSIGSTATDIGRALGLFTALLLCPGGGIGILWIAGLLEVGRLPESNFGLYFGLGSVGFPVGMFVVPLIGDFLMRTYGWRGAMLIMGGLAAHLIPLAMFNQPQIGDGLRNPQTTNREHIRGEGGATSKEDEEIIAQQSRTSTSTYRHDEQMSICEDALHEETVEINTEERAELLRETPDSCSQGNIQSRLERWAQIVKESDFYSNPCLLLFMVATTVHAITYGGWHTFLIPHAVERGMPVLQAITLSFCAGLANCVGRIGIGVFRDRFGRVMGTILVLTFLMTLSLLCDVFIPNFAVMYIATCFAAFSVASRAVLGLVFIKEKAPRSYDTGLALHSEAMGLGTMLGSYLAGFVADKFRTYNASFILLVCAEVLQFALYSLIRCSPF